MLRLRQYNLGADALTFRLCQFHLVLEFAVRRTPLQYGAAIHDCARRQQHTHNDPQTSIHYSPRYLLKFTMLPRANQMLWPKSQGHRTLTFCLNAPRRSNLCAHRATNPQRPLWSAGALLPLLRRQQTTQMSSPELRLNPKKRRLGRRTPKRSLWILPEFVGAFEQRAPAAAHKDPLPNEAVQISSK
jgi:hypothetical protein